MSSVVDEIKSRCNIIDVVGRYVQLKRAGSAYKGLCPFHSEKTPSFTVNENDGYYHCYGCGEHGDAFTFLQKIENIDFTTALSKLAEEYGVNMEDYGYRDDNKKKRIYDMNKKAARFYFENLIKSANPGYDYLLRRQLDPTSIKKFGLGYARNEWNDLLNHMTKLGYEPKEMEAAGLLSVSNGKYFDKFRNRVMFPIINTGGKVIGFGGRDLGDKGPKYLNSPGTAVFFKDNNLFGLNLSRNEIKKADYAIVVEGYMDMVSLYRNGICNVVASMGTALTKHQCMLLKRYAGTVVLSYDSDAAGQAATTRGIELLQKAGMKSRVLRIPDGKDPDDFVKKHGKLAFIELVDKAVPYEEYLISLIRKKHDIVSVEGRTDFLKEVARLLEGFSPIERAVYSKQIAMETKISEAAIEAEMNISTLSNEKSRKAETPDLSYKLSNIGNIKVQEHFIALLALDAEYINRIIPYEQVFEEPVYQRIYMAIKDVYAVDAYADTEKLMDAMEPDDTVYFQNVVNNVIVNENSNTVFEECRKNLERMQKEQDRDSLMHMMETMPDTPENEEQLNQILLQLQKINAK